MAKLTYGSLSFRDRLGLFLTEADMRLCARERNPNIWRLSHLLSAADRVESRIACGETEAKAFIAEFTATRETAWVARKLGLKLSVDSRGYFQEKA